MPQLHVEAFGDGPPAVFVHGTFGWGLDTFPEQRALANEYRVLLVDRRGFGRSGPPERAEGWPADMHDVAEVLDEVGPAHLVGQSYGAVVALLAAGLRPERVRSLVAIEPPAFGLARGDPHADASVAALQPAYRRAAELDARGFLSEWTRGRGMTAEQATAWTAQFGDLDWAAVEASRRERWPGEPPIDFDVLAAAPFPKVMVRGAWSADVAGREGAGRDFEAVCRVIAERIGARIEVFVRSTHNPQLQEPEPFNELLRALWAEAASTSGALR